MSQGVHSLVVWARFQSLEAKMRVAEEPATPLTLISVTVRINLSRALLHHPLSMSSLQLSLAPLFSLCLGLGLLLRLGRN
jgi:hypothetical protein